MVFPVRDHGRYKRDAGMRYATFTNRNAAPPGAPVITARDAGTDRDAFPVRAPRPRITRPVPGARFVKPGGPGTELKRFLLEAGLFGASGCQCNARARVMDEKGPDWCEQNMEVILGWLKEEASRVALPFVAPVVRLVVQKAIDAARKKEEGVPK